MAAFLALQKSRWTFSEKPNFVLMEHLVGVEVGVGAYFNGREFMTPVCIDWEHKRFFPGDLGELTGEMGTLVSYRGGERLFAATLAKLAPRLRESGYFGYINLNTIVNDRGIWPLELTCRFGYPGFAILQALHREGWDDLFRRMIAGDEMTFPTYDGFAVGVVLTIPPFPYLRNDLDVGRGLPVLFRTPPSEEDRRHLHLSEVALEGEQLITTGMSGYVMVVTGRGDTVTAARESAYRRVDKVCIPNVRYRNDIGERFQRRDRRTMLKLGWWQGNEGPL